MVRQRVRIRFAKQQDLRWIGHLDLVRCVERMFRRAEVRLSMSEGFHPKPRMTFPAALAVGIEGCEEVLEVELAQAANAEELRRRLEPHAPPGLTIRTIEVLPPGTPKARVGSFRYRLPLPADRRGGLPERIAGLLQAGSWLVERPEGKKPVDLRAALLELALREGVLHFRLRAGEPGQGAAGPRDVLAALALDDLEQQGVCLTRDAVELQP